MASVVFSMQICKYVQLQLFAEDGHSCEAIALESSYHKIQKVELAQAILCE